MAWLKTRTLPCPLAQSPPRLAVTVELQEEPPLGTTLTNLITAAYEKPDSAWVLKHGFEGPKILKEDYPHNIARFVLEYKNIIVGLRTHSHIVLYYGIYTIKKNAERFKMCILR